MSVPRDPSPPPHGTEPGKTPGMSGNQRSLPRSLEEAETALCRRAPAYETTRSLDVLRASDYARLDRAGHIYLDYTSGGLYAESQVRAHLDLLVNTTFGNPHSSNPTSLASTRLIDAREMR